MRTLLNIIWFVLSGFWLWLSYVAVGLLCCLLIITIPWGIGCLRMANYAAWPFGRRVVERPGSGGGALIGNIIWLLVAGIGLGLAHIATALALAVTIIGLPLAWANLKLLPVTLMPLGKMIVKDPR